MVEALAHAAHVWHTQGQLQLTDVFLIGYSEADAQALREAMDAHLKPN